MEFEPEEAGCVPSLLRLFFGMALIVVAAAVFIMVFL
jgi:hypothetical protein